MKFTPSRNDGQPFLGRKVLVTAGPTWVAVDRVRGALAQEHAERGVTMLVIEQNLDFVAGFAGRYGLIERGQITGEGSFSDSDAAARIDRHLTI